jgi:hypothetical protein
MLGGTAPASTALDATAPTAPCLYTIYFWGFKWMVPAPCPASANNGGTATDNPSTSTTGTHNTSH